MIGRVIAAVALLALLALLGCDANRAAVSPGGAPPDPGSATLAARLPLVERLGGPFLRHPRIHTVTFANDDAGLVSHLERFGDTIATSPWWREAVRSYCDDRGGCIGDGVPGRHVRLDAKPAGPLSEGDVVRILEREFARGSFGPVDADTLAVVYLPPGVGLHDVSRGRYCNGGPRALHRTLRVGADMVPFAVIPRCGDADQLTVSASHEILEATTNPSPSDRAFALRPAPDHLGFTAAGVEPADPCGLLAADGTWPVQDGFAVHRAWSNSAATRGTDPCVPAVDGPYVALLPAEPAVRLTAPGDTVHVAVEAVADQAASAWSASVFDLSGRQEGTSYVKATLDRDVVERGDSIVLTLQLVEPRVAGPLVIMLVSTLEGRSHRWPLSVVTT